MLTEVAVVVITKDRPSELAETLERLSGLSERPSIVVVDNGSEADYLPGLRARFPEVKVVALCGNFGSAARTIGVRLAEAEYVALADDDSWWGPGSLEQAVAILNEDPRVGLVAGRVIVEPGRGDDPISEAMASGPVQADLRTGSAGPRAVFGCMACSSVVRSRAYLSVGGFQPEFGVGGEEQLLVWDLWATGWRAVYEPSVVAHHRPAASRDPSARRANLTRNDLWSAWARLPWPAALGITTSVLRTGAPVPTMIGTFNALRRLDWAAARRTRLPKLVDSARGQVNTGRAGAEPYSA